MSIVSIEQALKQAIEQLSLISPSARVDAQLLLCFVLDKNTTYLFTWPEKQLEPLQLSSFEALIKRRSHGEPVAYLTGERGFWSLNLKTTNCTLIPRADTECLVECAIETVTGDNAKMLDLGTGTGAIALAIASEKEGWQIHACDFNQAAVDLANLNVQQMVKDNMLAQSTTVTIVQSDWFSAYEAQHLVSFDLIVSNPPYIDERDKHLDEGDLRFEPSSALVAKDSGFADIFYIIRHAERFLKPQGWLMIEHGFEQGKAVRQCFCEHRFVQVKTRKDLAGNDRFTLGKTVC
jgi:release factor glutamine methyltransferase